MISQNQNHDDDYHSRANNANNVYENICQKCKFARISANCCYSPQQQKCKMRKCQQQKTPVNGHFVCCCPKQQKRRRRKQQICNNYLTSSSHLPSLCYSTVIKGFARIIRSSPSRRQLSLISLSNFTPILLLITILLVGNPLDAAINDFGNSSPLLSTLDVSKNKQIKQKESLSKYHYTTVAKEPISFEQWINRTQQNNGIFLNHSLYSEGEVLLFRTKKSRHRAIAVMNVASFSSKFSDALTFKEWLKKVYAQEKALKVSVRTTEVVRPVLQHLYASKGAFRAPIIIHANTFANSGRHVGSASINEKPVDAVVFIGAVAEFLPEAVISLGWTQSSDYAAVNRLDWRQTFRLVGYIHRLTQPVILNMKLNDAVHSIEQLEWLLGVESLSIFVVLRGEITDFVDSDSPLQRLAMLSAKAATAHNILFDVDDAWRTRLRDTASTPSDSLVVQRKKEKRSVEPERWANLVFASTHEALSTSLVSTAGVAFLGWPNSLFVSTRPPTDYPARQTISGRVMFLPKRQTRGVSLAKESGMTVNLFEGPIELADSATPQIRNAIRIFFGYSGLVLIENTNYPSTADGYRKSRLKDSYRNKKKMNSSNTIARENYNKNYFYYSYYHKSSVGQLPQRPCYDFEIADRGWRVEVDIRSVNCQSNEYGDNLVSTKNNDLSARNHQLYLQLDTPITKSRKTRKVAIGKSGDDGIDFIFCEIHHTNGANYFRPLATTITFVSVQFCLSLQFTLR